MISTTHIAYYIHADHIHDIKTNADAFIEGYLADARHQAPLAEWANHSSLRIEEFTYISPQMNINRYFSCARAQQSLGNQGLRPS